MIAAKIKPAQMAILAIIFLVIEIVFYCYIDRSLALVVQHLDVNQHGLIDFFRRITDLGKSVWYLWPCGLATLFCIFLARGKDIPVHYRRLFAYIGIRTFFLFATIALSGIVADILKPIVGRSRPILFLRDGMYGFHPLTTQGFMWNSMPSGHSTTVFALAFSLFLFYPRLRVLWFLSAFLLAASRIMVDAHFLSDVCAGAMLGWLTVKLFFRYGMMRVWLYLFPSEGLPLRASERLRRVP